MARLRWIMLLLTVVFAVGVAAGPAAGDAVPRISVDDLKAMLGSPDVLILDVRQWGDWARDDIKIKGAVRMDPTDFETWQNQLPRDKTIVLYCA